MRGFFAALLVAALLAAHPVWAADAAKAQGAKAKKSAKVRSPNVFDVAGAIALSFVTAPARLAMTVVLTPVYLLRKASDARTGKDEAEEFAQKYILGDYAVRPEHLTGEAQYHFYAKDRP